MASLPTENVENTSCVGFEAMFDFLASQRPPTICESCRDLQLSAPSSTYEKTYERPTKFKTPEESNQEKLSRWHSRNI